jgi:hypothetical protein
MTGKRVSTILYINPSFLLLSNFPQFALTVLSGTIAQHSMQFVLITTGTVSRLSMTGVVSLRHKSAACH